MKQMQKVRIRMISFCRDIIVKAARKVEEIRKRSKKIKEEELKKTNMFSFDK
jgi:hypothetical protein